MKNMFPMEIFLYLLTAIIYLYLYQYLYILDNFWGNMSKLTTVIISTKGLGSGVRKDSQRSFIFICCVWILIQKIYSWGTVWLKFNTVLKNNSGPPESKTNACSHYISEKPFLPGKPFLYGYFFIQSIKIIVLSKIVFTCCLAAVLC